jgi:sugar phosphate isomerase/epimerase
VLYGRDMADDERERAAGVVRDLAAAAAESGSEISLELHDDGMLDSAEFCLDMVRRVAAKNVGVNPDLGNLIRGGASPGAWREALTKLAPCTNNWHVKNYKNTQPAPIWDGEIDYAQAMSIMRSAGYRGWVSIESYFGDVLDLQRRSLQYLRELERNATGEHPAVRESAATP